MMNTAPERVGGTVAEWFDEEGWGRLRSRELNGPVFAHFSAISDQTGYRELRPGQAVTFAWVDYPHEGCRFRAVDVRSDPPNAPAEHPTEVSPPGAYRSSLTIRWEGDDQAPPTP